MNAEKTELKESEAKARVRIVVRGLVQGVFFRWNARLRAQQLGVFGFVRNLADGESVEVVAEGEKPRLRAFLEWCKRGPDGAEVRDARVEWSDCKNEFSDFQIRY
ncbi:MAG: acylphosphatase [Candidatus Micrarchaeota archaeon]